MVINAAVWDIDEVSVYPWGNIFSIYLYTSVCVFCNMIRLLRRHSIEYVIFPNSYIKTKKKNCGLSQLLHLLCHPLLWWGLSIPRYIEAMIWFGTSRNHPRSSSWESSQLYSASPRPMEGWKESNVVVPK